MEKIITFFKHRGDVETKNHLILENEEKFGELNNLLFKSKKWAISC